MVSSMLHQNELNQFDWVMVKRNERERQVFQIVQFDLNLKLAQFRVSVRVRVRFIKGIWPKSAMIAYLLI